MKITNEVLSIITKGAIVTFEMGTTHKTLIFRMPKGKFIQDKRNSEESNEFEFVIVQNFMDIYELSISGFKNGSKNEVQKRVYNEELRFSYGNN